MTTGRRVAGLLWRKICGERRRREFVGRERQCSGVAASIGQQWENSRIPEDLRETKHPATSSSENVFAVGRRCAFWSETIIWRGFIVLVCSVCLAGCSVMRPTFDSSSKVARSTLALPPSVEKTLERKGFKPLPRAEAEHPKRAWWCVRPVNIPGGRMAAAVGWFHEWILTPNFEMGADCEGADSVRGTWPPSLLSFFKPLKASDHRGAARSETVYAREIPEGQNQDAFLKAALETPRAGWLPFPFHHCNTWVRKVIRKSRDYEIRGQGSPLQR